MSDTPPTRPSPSNAMMLRIFAALAAAAVLLVALVLVTRGPSGSPASLIGGPFTLQTGDGRTVTDADMAGHPFLVYFGYTHCPDICPATLAEIADVLRRLPDKPIKVLFITVDPERDTPALMADYVSSFDPRIVGLSGSIAAVGAAEKAYRVYARKAPASANGDYGMDHSSVIYLMDAKGAFVEAFNLERKPEESAKELAEYL